MEKENINNKIYFIVSDIHSFYDELIEALNTAGYDKDNPEHMLIVCGDIFDRGPKTKEVYDYLRSIPRERRVLIRGNHEDLFIDLLKKDYPDVYDFSNKTTRAFCQLAGFDEDCLIVSAYVHHDGSAVAGPTAMSYWKQITDIVKGMRIAEWINSDEWVNYYELDRFIFVHSFIPLLKISHFYVADDMPNINDYVYTTEWRTHSTEHDWSSARWGCPWKQYNSGYFQQEEDLGKTLVCGHWHVSDFHRYLGRDYSDNTDIYYSKGLIGIDGGVMRYEDEYYHPCNVLVIENGKCYDKNGTELKEKN